MDLINRYFDKIYAVAPEVKKQQITYPEKRYGKEIRLLPANFTSDGSFIGKLKLLLKAPKLMFQIHRAAKKVDVVHLRCPGNVAFVGLFAFLFSRKKCFIKYAGQWKNYKGESLSYRIQKFLIKHFYRKSLVMVYGDKNKDKNIEPFFATSVTRKDVKNASKKKKVLSGNIKLITVSRIVKGKRIDTILHALRLLPEQYQLTIVGDGEEKANLERLVSKLNLRDRVIFTGQLPFSELKALYSQHHLFVLASEPFEGFPKVLLEAMAYGIPAIASDIGINRFTLFERGLVFRLGDHHNLMEKIIRLSQDKELYSLYSKNARKYASKHTLQDLDELFIKMFLKYGIING
jgi:glycosyltransferase involved in cell wall biosynthesis